MAALDGHVNNLLRLNPVSTGVTFRVFYTAAIGVHVNNLLRLNPVSAGVTFRVFYTAALIIIITFIKRHKSRNINSEALYMSIYMCCRIIILSLLM